MEQQTGTVTPDGQFIIGLTTPTTTSTYLFVYEVASGTIVRSRIGNSVSRQCFRWHPTAPDSWPASRYMTRPGLGVIAQANNANAPWTIANPFNVQTNVGGSVSHAGRRYKIYSAFNNALTGTPTPPPQSSTLFINDSTNLGIQLGIRLPGEHSGPYGHVRRWHQTLSPPSPASLYLPISTLYNNPILQLQTTEVFLSQESCNPGLVTGQLQVLNTQARVSSLSGSTPRPPPP